MILAVITLISIVYTIIIFCLLYISTVPINDTTTVIPISSMTLKSDSASTVNDDSTTTSIFVTSIGTGIVTSVTSTPAVSSSTMTTNTLTTSTMAPADTQSSSDSSDDSSVGIIVGCIIGVVLCITLLLLVVILLWYFSKRRKGKLELPQGKSEYNFIPYM